MISARQSVRTLATSKGAQTKIALTHQLKVLEAMPHSSRIEFVLALPRVIHGDGTCNDTIYLSPPKTMLLESVLADLPNLTPLELCSRLILARLNQIGSLAASVAEAPAVEPSANADFSFASSSVDLLTAINANEGSQQRDQQSRMVQLMDSHTRNKGLKLIEAPTGTGKTRAYATVIANHVGRDLLETEQRKEAGLDPLPKKQFGVALPTLALMQQFRREFDVALLVAESLSGRNGFASEVSVVYLRGRPNYISSQLCEAFLLEQVDPAHEGLKLLLRQWMDAQAKMVAEEDPGRIGLESDSAWLVDSLLDTPGFAAVATGLVCTPNTPASDLGLQRYQRVMKLAFSANVVVCSHAMLCIDSRLKLQQRRKKASSLGAEITREQYAQECLERITEMSFDEWQIMMLSDYEEAAGVLPEFHFGVVDEGHQLDEAMASASSHDLALVSLKNDESVIAAPRAKAAVEQVFNAMREYARRHPTLDAIQLLDRDADNQTIRSAGVGYAGDLVAALEKVPVKKRSYAVKRAIQGLKFALNAKTSGTFFQMSFSPLRLFPKFVIGPRSVSAYMMALWENFDSAVAISATFYVPTHDGSLSADFMEKVLNARIKHQAAIIPAPDWLYSPVTLNIPSSANLMAPPSNASAQIDSDASQAWVDSMYAYLRDEVLASAAGGVLVLIASYGLQKSLCQRFQADPEMLAKFDVFASDRKTPLSVIKTKFEQSYLAGNQPLWFAVGPGAWTGMDLRVETDPSVPDNLCTDLVITKLPFEVTTSTVMQTRVKQSFKAALDRVYMQLKQAMGRLVRKHGLPSNRRIFILDPRAIESRYKSHFSSAFKPYLSSRASVRR